MKFKSTAKIIYLINAVVLWCFVTPLQIGDTKNDVITTSISKTCLEPKAPGLCRGKVLRYAYDHKSKSCLGFYYSGCGANHNNFVTYEECRRECTAQKRY